MRAALFLFGVLVCLVATVRADGPRRRLDSGEQVIVDADSLSYDKTTDTISATGNVMIRRGETELMADQVILRRATNEAEAYGNVSLSDPEGVLFAETILLNLDDETGALTGAALKSRRLQYSLWGSRIEKGLGQSYRIQNGRFTTCNCEEGRQAWSISGKALEVTLDGYGILRGATFNILDVPVLYVPRAVIPVQRERQSGFIMPRFGASNRRGFQTLLPFYWAISKTQDATIGFDLETSARLGALAEYRYALSRTSRGILAASYFNEAIRGEGPRTANTVAANRWNFATNQRQVTFGGGLAYADALIVSDDQFFRDINTYAFDHRRTVAMRTLPYTATRLGALQVWDSAAARLEADYYQDLGRESESGTLQAVPRLNVWGQKTLGSFLLADVAAEAVDFQRGRGTAGGRLDINPGVTIAVPMRRYGFGSLRISGRETGYLLSESRVDAAAPRDLPSRSNRETFDVRAEMGTVFNRIYDVHRFGFEKVKHTIEPVGGYFYVPATAQGDLPLWDGVDRINHRNLLTYGVVTRLIGKEERSADDSNTDRRPPIREIARLSLLQSYDFSREIPPLGRTGAADHFSDIDVAGRINPNRFFSFRFLTHYDTLAHDFSGARVGFFVEDPRERSDEARARRLDTRTSAGVSYRFLVGNQLEQVDTNVVLRLTDWAGFLYSSRYNIQANRFLDNFVGLRLLSSCDCWALDLAVTNRTNPAETEVRAQVTLVGLSSAKQASRVAAMP